MRTTHLRTAMLALLIVTITLPISIPVRGKSVYPVSFYIIPSSNPFPGASYAGSITACGGTFYNNQSTTSCGSSFYATASYPGGNAIGYFNNWPFVGWKWSGGVSCTYYLVNSNPITCEISGPGSLTAVYSPRIGYFAIPSTGGNITLASETSGCEPSVGGHLDVLYEFSEEFAFNKTFVVCANPAPGYVFSRWTSSGNITLASPSSNPNSLYLIGPGNITAHFLYTLPTSVTFQTNPNTNPFLGANSAGSIEACGSTFYNNQTSASCGNSFTATARLPFSSYPNSWSFSGWDWSGGVSCLDNRTANPTSCTVSGVSGSLRAVYTYSPPIAITFKTSPIVNQFVETSSAGSISACGYTFYNGQSSTSCGRQFKATANSFGLRGWQFFGWQWNGSISCSETSANSTACIVEGPGSLTAIYAAKLNLPPTPGGNVNVFNILNTNTFNSLNIDRNCIPSQGKSVGYGVPLPFYPQVFNYTFEACADPSPGYIFSGWNVSGDVTIDGSAFSNPVNVTITGPGNITAHFTPDSSSSTQNFILSLNDSLNVPVEGHTIGVADCMNLFSARVPKNYCWLTC